MHAIDWPAVTAACTAASKRAFASTHSAEPSGRARNSSSSLVLQKLSPAFSTQLWQVVSSLHLRTSCTTDLLQVISLLFLQLLLHLNQARQHSKKEGSKGEARGLHAELSCGQCNQLHPIKAHLQVQGAEARKERRCKELGVRILRPRFIAGLALTDSFLETFSHARPAAGFCWPIGKTTGL